MEKKDAKQVKKHWHLLVWEVPSIGLPKKISTYMNSKKRLASIPEVNNARAERQVPDGSVIIGFTYLGYGSQYELTGQSPVPAASSLTGMYIDGMEAALKALNPDTVVNPYSGPEHDAFLAQEWQLGFIQGERLRGVCPIVTQEGN